MKMSVMPILAVCLLSTSACAAGMQAVATPVQSASTTLPGHVSIRVAGNAGYNAGAGSPLGGEAHVGIGYDTGEVQLSAGAEGVADTNFIDDKPRFRARVGLKQEMNPGRVAVLIGLGFNDAVNGSYATIDGGMASQFEMTPDLDFLMGWKVGLQRNVGKKDYQQIEPCVDCGTSTHLVSDSSSDWIFGAQAYVGMRILMRGDRIQGLPESALTLGLVPLDFIIAHDGFDLGARFNLSFEHEF